MNSIHTPRLVLLVIMAVLSSFALRYRTAVVIGDSMRPTFSNGDILLVDRLAYSYEMPERGDVVIAQAGQDVIVKRVVGKPNETVRVENGVLYVDGVPYPEPELALGDVTIEEGTLGKERYALLGDNRTLPPSQLVHAVVPRREISGKVVLRIPLGG